MKYRTLVVDDEPYACKLLASYIAKIEYLELVATCNDAIHANNFLSRETVDLVFLDIQMPEMDGFQLLRTLRNPPSIVLTTAFRHFASEAFEAEAIDYLLKPISFERFIKAVNRFVEKQKGHGSMSPSDSIIFVKADRKQHKVNVNDILYVESLDEYIKVHLRDKVLISHETITVMEEILSAADFVRIHRSFLVSARHVTSVSSDGVEVEGQPLPFGRTYKLTAMAALGPRQ